MLTRKFASLALIGALSVGAALWSNGAQARPYVDVGIVPAYGVPYGVQYVRPYPFYHGPYGYRRGWYGPHYHYGHYGYGHYGYGRPWR